jgi:hypothetical protein
LFRHRRGRFTIKKARLLVSEICRGVEAACHFSGVEKNAKATVSQQLDTSWCQTAPGVLRILPSGCYGAAYGEFHCQ